MRSWTAIAACLVLVLVQAMCVAEEPSTWPLEYAPAPVDNPLKGLVPYQGEVRDRFPHSLEFNYVGYGELVRGYETFDWTALERMLDDIASRGHQAVFRVYLEYPGKRNVVPEFLLRDGLRVTSWQYTETQPFPPAMLETPDYANPKLRESLQKFIAALGKKYDGDRRVGFITAGLLGVWGEWHNYPRNDLFASKAVQEEVLAAYREAFRVTPILVRYPVGKGDAGRASNAELPFGYHDDSFAWATLDTGKKDDDWFFVPALKQAGPAAVAKWKTQPIGGEIRPEAWGRIFDPQPAKGPVQNFRRCVDETHVTWLMDSGLFERPPSPERVSRAKQEVARMGYEFHVTSVTIGGAAEQAAPPKVLRVKLAIENRGVAPFYYDWPAEWGLLAEGKVVQTFAASGKLPGLLPGEPAREWADVLPIKPVPAGKYTLAIRVPNPLPNGHPLRFANRTQDATLPGWLSLGPVTVP